MYQFMAPFNPIPRVEKCFKNVFVLKLKDVHNVVFKTVYIFENSLKNNFTWFSLPTWSKGFNEGQKSHREFAVQSTAMEGHIVKCHC